MSAGVSDFNAGHDKYRNESDDEYDVTIAKDLDRRVKRLGDQSIDVAIRAKEAREMLAFHTNHIKRAWVEWFEESSKVFADIKQTRVAIEWESKALLSACKDVRQFFMDPQHAAEVERLKEFVAVVERLKALKADGTLDAIADTILKLGMSHDEQPRTTC